MAFGKPSMAWGSPARGIPSSIDGAQGSIDGAQCESDGAWNAISCVGWALAHRLDRMATDGKVG
jgi:hypothetical protein